MINVLRFTRSKIRCCLEIKSQILITSGTKLNYYKILVCFLSVLFMPLFERIKLKVFSKVFYAENR